MRNGESWAIWTLAEAVYRERYKTEERQQAGGGLWGQPVRKKPETLIHPQAPHLVLLWLLPLGSAELQARLGLSPPHPPQSRLLPASWAARTPAHRGAEAKAFG